jgi:hypothetical protein
MITLTSAATLFVPGAINELDAHATLFYLELSFPTSVRLFYKVGNGVNGGSPPQGTFTPSTAVPTVVIDLNLATGVWVSNTGLSGIASGDGFIALQNDFLNAVNDAEAFGTAVSAVLGVSESWTSDVYTP